MIVGLSIALGLTIVACFVLLDRRDKRTLAAIDKLVEAHRLQVIGLLERQDREREAGRAELRTLLVHVQAPQQAVMQALVEQAGPDEDRPLTDEEMVALQEQADAIARLEALERNGLDGLLQ